MLTKNFQYPQGITGLTIIINFQTQETKMGVNRVDGNKKGVFTRNRQPKMAAYMLKDRWSKKK